jgi:diguanylate cyclase (GGDEF)-like protein/PAS domain S-box-containing protein
LKPEQFSQLKLKWKDFINGIDKQWDVSYQMKSSKGKWYWYRDIGRVISRDVKGLPTRVSGTYTNITETKVNEAQAILYGEAFSQINDWVLILDVAKYPVTVNEAFMKAFGLDNISIIPSLKLILSKLGEQKYHQFKEIIEQIEPKGSWQGEEVIETTTSDKHPVLIKINAIAKDNTISHYVIVISDITIQKHAEEKLRHLAHYDYLTDLPNRKLIIGKLEEKIKHPEKQCALFFIDLDKFKQVNDLYGHIVGDNLLRYVAKTLIGCVKHYVLVARQSGDEFMILFDSFNSIDDLSHIAQRINTNLSKTIILQGNHLNITSSIGISIYPNDSSSSTGLIKKADLAMMHAKQESRGNFQFFTRDMNEKAHQRLFLENELRKACDSKCLTNFYQPIVNQVQEKVIGFELLLRWRHEGEMISPGIFIPIAEDIGLISQMTVDAIDQALSDYSLWKDQFPDSYISVNLSPIHILQGGLSQTLNTLLNKHQLPASTLRLEITEGTLLVDLDVALTRLNELQSQGFKLLLDDFGTGYSSLTYLSKFPVNVLKIDKSFVLNLATNPMNKPIIKSIISLANNLGLSCIAEGVETESQLMYLQNLGCEAIQGFYFAKPMPAEEVIISAINIFKELSPNK